MSTRRHVVILIQGSGDVIFNQIGMDLTQDEVMNIALTLIHHSMAPRLYGEVLIMEIDGREIARALKGLVAIQFPRKDDQDGGDKAREVPDLRATD